MTNGKYKFCLLLMAVVILLGGCKKIVSILVWKNRTGGVYCEQPKQGDLLEFEIKASPKDKVEYIEYRIGDLTARTDKNPHYVQFDSCKETRNKYYSDLTVSAEAHYSDGKTKTIDYTYDLSYSDPQYNEGATLNYNYYIAWDSDDVIRRIDRKMANAFIDSFDALPLDGGNWSRNDPEKWLSQKRAALESVDMIISASHGAPHEIKAWSEDNNFKWIDLSTIALGSLSECNFTGDLEFLILLSCNTLSLDNINGEDYFYYWFNTEITKLKKRPFTGLHMVAGFYTVFRIQQGVSGPFMRAFANKLDANYKFRLAWFDAIEEMLEIESGANCGALFCIQENYNDRLREGCYNNDYIYKNHAYIPVSNYIIIR